MAERGMGRGLAAILSVSKPAEGAAQPAELRELPVELIRANPAQPRKRFDDDALQALAGSLGERGVVQPILVRPVAGGTYEIVAGERRWRAATLAGLRTVPALLLGAGEVQGREVALIENLHRTDLRPLELAQALDALLRLGGMTHEELAGRLGKSRVSVTNTLRLLGLGYQAQQALSTGRISEGHARALLGLSGTLQDQALGEVLLRDLSVRQAEALVRRLASRKTPVVAETHPHELEPLAGALRTSLGTKVALQGTEQAGRIVIEYHSREELERLCRHIGGEALLGELT